MQDCKPRSKPCDEGLDKELDESPKLEDPRLYREIVGSLVYAMCCTRPDLSYVVNKLSQKMSEPTERDLVTAKGVLRYIKGTTDYGVTFSKSTENLSGFCDADWASSSDRYSISGYIFMKGSENPSYISWKSKKQPTVALSTCEAEYMALALCVQEAIFLIKLMSDMYTEVHLPVQIGVDNQGAIQLAKNPVKHQRTKHIDVRYHFIREHVSNSTVSIFYVPSSLNVSDALTKPLSKQRLDSLIRLI